MTRQAAFRYLQQHKALAFLMEFYDVEHLQSMDDTIDDMLIICRQNGGTLAWYLTDYALSELVRYVMEDTGCSLEQAMERVYNLCGLYDAGKHPFSANRWIAMFNNCIS